MGPLEGPGTACSVFGDADVGWLGDSEVEIGNSHMLPLGRDDSGMDALACLGTV